MRQAKTGSRVEKIVLLGAQSSGKTSIVTRIQNNTFNANAGSTIGAAFTSKIMMVDDTQVKLDIWDTAGSEKYKSLIPMYYRDARAAIIVLDVTREETIPAAVEWLNELREHGKQDCVVVCAANKVDLTSQRVITSEQVADFAFSNQVSLYKETSALTGSGIQELFNETARLLIKLPAVESQEDTELKGLVGNLDTTNQPPPKSGCC
ncbi:Ras family protein [Trichomonas vaginalis G3]|uniref:Ras family protein n=2 Tax=Trichomonas vaginalis TaxID=5722 RepID=A0A8U0WPD7_TRIV3|nr:small Rab GTPase Rab5c [Trichomonas vaginalis G3]AAY83817.1 small Rab GTPase Rab5c [Trichomonas vaginalis]EAX94558.1 Ras family protein [Trichomonas vaginalis G3]KAI5525871.1 small Rab GTPase Rab5c [Trichomonas vaginalis G3]|eukprot:XP_001307488.1 Ras family protein [Trichomonas vaginalis G3]